jgi:para-nitrobenzyl esterase
MLRRFFCHPRRVKKPEMQQGGTIMSAAAKFVRDHRPGDNPSAARTDRSDGQLPGVRLALSVALMLSAFAPAALGQIVAAPISEDPVTIDSGLVSGKVLASGVKAYFGVPYASPPVGELRWREPQPMRSWQGVYHADRMAPECIQVLRRHNLNHYFGEEATSEDCLYLNIWASKDAKAGAKLPVIVYIYGGGFTLGSSGMAMYGGENVASKGTIFVSFNYRVGALGNMAHPELTAESSHHASGNYGFHDQVAALQWVHRNIDRFGGDPDNVTISGQSAGAMSVSALEASPLAMGLFKRGFAMSLSLFDNRFHFAPLAEAEKTGLEVQTALGANSLAEMRLMSADKILALQKDCQLGCAGTVAVGPDIDGHFLPDTVPNIFAAGKQNDVATISGFTRDESSNDLRTAANLEAYIAVARKLYGDQAERFLTLYPASNDQQAKAMGLAAAREGQAEAGTRNWALAQHKTGTAPFYMYMFSRVHPFAENVKFFDNPIAIGAYHTSDVPYWFQTLDAMNKIRVTRVWTEFDRDLSNRMADCLVAFARTGDPATPATLWPQWTPKSEKFIEFGDTTEVREESAERMEFHTPANVTPSTPRISRD